MWEHLLLFILIPLMETVALMSDETRRHLLWKCGHLSNNESMSHCIMRELQLLELKHSIETAIERDLLQTRSVIGEFRAAKVSYSCVGELCEMESTTNAPPNIAIVPPTKPPPELKINSNRYWFNLAHFVHSRVDRAEILFHLNYFRKNYVNQTYIVSLSKFGPSNSIAEHFSKIYRFDQIPMAGGDEDYTEDDVRQDDWLNIEVTNYFDEWKINPLTNYGLQMNVAVQDDQGNIRVIENLRQSNRNIYIQILNPQREHRPKRRSNRSAQVNKAESNSQNCTNGKDGTTCCLYSFEVPSHELGLNWSLEPSVLKLNYCFGQCSADGTGCCTAEKRSPLEIRYRTRYDGPLKSKNISNTLIQTCSCL